MTGFDLEGLRKIFEDKRVHVAIAKIKKVEVSKDRSVLRCLVSIFPEGREVIVRYSWAATAPNAGIYFFPVVGDAVVCVFADGNNSDGYIVARLSSQEDKIPQNALAGDLLLKAMDEKKAWLTAKLIYLTQGDSAPTENLVLGQELKTFLIDLLTGLIDLCTLLGTHTHTGNLGYPTAPPDQFAQFEEAKIEFEALKESPVEDDSLLSKFAFTEKGT